MSRTTNPVTDPCHAGRFDRRYEAACRAQIVEAADCVAGDQWRASRFAESFTDQFVARARSSRCVLDIGAERGFYTHLALRYMAPPGRVVAVEPDPVRCAVLRSFFARDRRVSVVEAAVGATSGWLTLTRPAGKSASAVAARGDSFTARCVRVDDLPDARTTDLVKIDVEGAEAEVLAGMPALFARRCCQLFVEYHPWAEQVTPGARDRIRALAAAAGYDIRRTDIETRDPARAVGGRMILTPAAF